MLSIYAVIIEKLGKQLFLGALRGVMPRTTETPPSSQALERRLIVDRKQCVYSDIRRGSTSACEDKDKTHHSSFPNKNSVLARSHDQVLSNGKMSNGTVKEVPKMPKSNAVGVTVSPRRKSIHSTRDSESQLHRGANVLNS